jgi:hypothetical protein
VLINSTAFAVRATGEISSETKLEGSVFHPKQIEIEASSNSHA